MSEWKLNNKFNFEGREVCHGFVGNESRKWSSVSLASNWKLKAKTCLPLPGKHKKSFTIKALIRISC